MLWQSVLLVMETGVPEKSIDLSQVTDKSLLHNVVWSTPRRSEIRTYNFIGDKH